MDERTEVPRDEARVAVVTIEYEIPIDLDDFPDLTEEELREMADSMAELIAQEGVEVAPEAPVRFYA